VQHVTSPYVIDYRGTFDLAASPDEVWATVADVDHFESWWGWLREFRLEGGGLVAGAVLHGVIVPPLPYRMRLRVELRECVPGERVEATVGGDLEGTARIVFERDGDDTRASVDWTIEMVQRPMRLAARFGHPLLRWGHDRVVDATVAGFRRHLADRSAGGRCLGHPGEGERQRRHDHGPGQRP
jgi:carbon monoxide dehydrogenase subunit G